MLDVQLDFGRRKMPTILQSEAAECGLACLAMVASHHGLRTDLATLRGRFSLSLKGATLEQLMTCAEQLKLKGRALRLELDELAQLKVPCILHWRMNHFVVLERAGAKGVVIHDPAARTVEHAFDAGGTIS
jgi:ATP-binding cassette subfamily B protein RaxB